MVTVVIKTTVVECSCNSLKALFLFYVCQQCTVDIVFGFMIHAELLQWTCHRDKELQDIFKSKIFSLQQQYDIGS